MNLQTLREDVDDRKIGGADHTPHLVSDGDDVRSHSKDDDDTLIDDEYDDDLQNRGSKPPQQSVFDSKLHEQYNMMIHMTLELVRDTTIVKKNDEVLTSYGKGVLLTRNGSCGSMEIQLPFGAKLYHRQPEMVHKLLSPENYEQSIDYLEEVRTLGLTRFALHACLTNPIATPQTTMITAKPLLAKTRRNYRQLRLLKEAERT
jgi:hypothetical protein